MSNRSKCQNKDNYNQMSIYMLYIYIIYILYIYILGPCRVDRILVDELNTGTTPVQIKLLVIRGEVV